MIDLKLKIEIKGQATFDDVVDYISLLCGGSCHAYNPLMSSPYIEADVVSGTIKEKGTKNIHIFKAKEKRAKPYADKENAIVMNLNQFTDVGDIDYSYTDIDIKQLYAQVLAEQKK